MKCMVFMQSVFYLTDTKGDTEWVIVGAAAVLVVLLLTIELNLPICSVKLA